MRKQNRHEYCNNIAEMINQQQYFQHMKFQRQQGVLIEQTNN